MSIEYLTQSSRYRAPNLSCPAVVDNPSSELPAAHARKGALAKPTFPLTHRSLSYRNRHSASFLVPQKQSRLAFWLVSNLKLAFRSFVPRLVDTHPGPTNAHITHLPLGLSRACTSMLL
ncbi:Vegetative incompatibility protein HET-E-1 [Fusarium oxysporum f. sp. albedinis]|nr:Vegetative incompatibility protein HET-E-1 [Fusarium oxysporum f. sp. albedinis]